ncbi:hypothetical protein LCGC14_1872230, partial [marine sediment metagenome]
MSIFGNRVVNGWIIAIQEAFNISVGEGFG